MNVIVHRGRQIREALEAAGLTGEALDEATRHLYRAVATAGEAVWWGAEPIRFTHYKLDAYRRQPPIRKIPWIRYGSTKRHEPIRSHETFFEYYVEAEPVLNLSSPTRAEGAIAARLAHAPARQS